MKIIARETKKLFQIGLMVSALFALSTNCAWTFDQHQRQSVFAARRAADDSRLLVRHANSQQIKHQLARSESHESPIVVGKFRAPASERIYKQRVPKSSQSAAQIMSASYQVADQFGTGSADMIVHGIAGASTARQPQGRPDQRTVGARMQVSDEGLNYPPSKLSADIYGNVAEIVTAPPETVDNDFLLPDSRRFSG